MDYKKRIGTYITEKAAGESYRAYVPLPLPPKPVLDLTLLYPYLEKATLALAELNSIHKSIPNISLFVYMYVKRPYFRARLKELKVLFQTLYFLSISKSLQFP
jgi:hypothetical protein